MTGRSITFESRYAKSQLPSTAPFRNTIIAESESFFALPSIGALVEGWVLIVPKQPALALAALGQNTFQELSDFTAEVTSLVSREYGDVAMFEHGPAKSSINVGCGVDHAHLHIVPIKENLLSAAQKLFPEISWQKIDSISCAQFYHREAYSYLYLHQPSCSDGHFLAITATDFPSQLFRKVIARSLGDFVDFDWKSNPNPSIMQKTCDRLSRSEALIA